MATVFDFAAAILQRTGPIEPERLHALLYYVQAWSLVKLGKPAFEEKIYAWDPKECSLDEFFSGQNDAPPRYDSPA